ncbi:MAG: YeeE/YedE family protein, partial [Phycisphaeraceae bacterium]|nr:YeeE/YedE family protein [Phycisphaeraceae bacterium]
GFLLHKAGVTRYQTILGQFLFKDFTVLKVMLTAIITGAVGIWGMRAMGMEFPMHIKAATLAPNIVGGLIFGVGMALLGFCPGTGVAAIGDGSRHAIVGLLGMFAGGLIYAYTYPHIMGGFLKSGDLTATVGGKTTDKVTFADVTALSPWWFIVGLIVISLIVFVLIEKHGPKACLRNLEDHD